MFIKKIFEKFPRGSCFFPSEGAPSSKPYPLCASMSSSHNEEFTCMVGEENGSEIANPQFEEDGGTEVAIVQDGKLWVKSSSSPSGFGATDLIK